MPTVPQLIPRANNPVIPLGANLDPPPKHNNKSLNSPPNQQFVSLYVVGWVLDDVLEK